MDPIKLSLDPNAYPYLISIHAPARGATPRVELSSMSYQFQFTPLREGRHMENVSKPSRICISIHAPARGATYPQRQHRPKWRISIHAPARGAT